MHESIIIFLSSFYRVNFTKIARGFWPERFRFYNLWLLSVLIWVISMFSLLLMTSKIISSIFPVFVESASNSYASVSLDHLLCFLDFFTSVLREETPIWRLLINSSFFFLSFSSSSNLVVKNSTLKLKSISCLLSLIFITLLLLAKM